MAELVSGEGNENVSNISPIAPKTITSSSCPLPPKSDESESEIKGRNIDMVATAISDSLSDLSCCLCRKVGEVIAGFVGDTPLIFCERCYKAFEKEGREHFNVGDRVLVRLERCVEQKSAPQDGCTHSSTHLSEEADCNPLANRLVCWRLDGNGGTPFVVEVEKVV